MPDGERGASRKALELLARREYGVAELAARLARGGFPEAGIEAAIKQLVARGLLSDQRFVEAFIRGRQARGVGPVRVRQELRGKAIEPDVIDEWVDDRDPVWIDTLRRTYQKKYRGESVEDYNSWTKRARFLQTKGFTLEQIREVLGDWHDC